MKMNPYCRFKAEDLRAFISRVTPEEVTTSLTAPEPTFTDFLRFLSPAAREFMPQMTAVATGVRRRYFGRTVRLFAPLYISNYCVNNCVYCGFRRSYQYPRRRLSPEEVVAEAQIIRGMGHESLLLITGEDPMITPEFTADCVRKIRSACNFSYISMEYYPMTEEKYRLIRDAGCNGLTMFQETYDPELYPQFHPSGPKANYFFRLNAPSEGGKAGFHNLGLGALLGLNPDWRIEAANMAVHALWLRKHYWRSHLQFSFPRITPVQWGYNVPSPLSDKELEQLMLAFRLFFRDADQVLSTRETPEFRLRMAESCATHLSAGSQVNPGGYRDHLEGKSLGQFTMNDPSTVESVCEGLRAHGLQPVFKDWSEVFQA